ncbi:MAG: nuclear transport factor 2 family protein [Marivirga sp.]|nr:nuclear transport factor 2 family protein [Marivirga sp.]
MHHTIIISLLVVLVSCRGPGIKGSDAVSIASGMFDAFNQHEWGKMAGYYSDSALFLDPAFGKEYVTQSRASIIQKYKGFEEAFPDIQDQIVGMYASGDKVTVEFISTGNSPDGTSFRLPIVTVLTITNNLIVKDATYYDVENP